MLFHDMYLLFQMMKKCCLVPGTRSRRSAVEVVGFGFDAMTPRSWMLSTLFATMIFSPQAFFCTVATRDRVAQLPYNIEFFLRSPPIDTSLLIYICILFIHWFDCSPETDGFAWRREWLPSRGGGVITLQFFSLVYCLCFNSSSDDWISAMTWWWDTYINGHRSIFLWENPILHDSFTIIICFVYHSAQAKSRKETLVGTTGPSSAP